MIDLDRLKADRDAIWSAAYKAYLDGAPHVWTSYELSTMSSYLEGFTGDSPLDALLARALEVRRSGIWRGTPYVTIADVYDWLDIPVTQQSQMQQPIADTLKRMGWVLRRTTMNNRQVRMWIRPDS
jgi:predicted P-loop ATPase